MGEKRVGAGKHVYLLIAGLSLFLSGCTLFNKATGPGETREALNRAQALLSQGDYEGSMRENQQALALAGNVSPADEAIFNMGLIYAHVGNPKKDYRKAIGLFRRVVKEYPESPLVEQAKSWVGVLQTNEKLTQMIEKSKKVDLEIEEKKRER